MKNWLGQTLEPGVVVAKGGSGREPMRIGVVQSVDDTDNTVKVKWAYEAGWRHGERDRFTGYGGRPGNCTADYLAVVDPASFDFEL